MGQKVNPNGLRIGITRGWSGQWYADRKTFAKTLKQDIDIRRFLEPKLKVAGLSRIDIRRGKTLTIACFVQKPGIVLGQGHGVSENPVAPVKAPVVPAAPAAAAPAPAEGAAAAPAAEAKDEKKEAKKAKPVKAPLPLFQELKNGLEKIVNHKVTPKQLATKKKGDVEIQLVMVEVKNPDMDAMLVAQSIASQIEQRASFRMVQKKAIQRVMKAGAQGIKTQTGGRLNGAEIARDEEYKEGALGLETLSNNIDYALAEAHTVYGVIGVKVWIARPKGFDENKASQRPVDNRRFGRGGFDRNRRGGFNRFNNNRPQQGRPAVVPSSEKKGE